MSNESIISLFTEWMKDNNYLKTGVDKKGNYLWCPDGNNGHVAKTTEELFEHYKRNFHPQSEPPPPSKPETISTEGEKEDEFKIAVRALEIMAIEHKLPIDIKYRPKINTVSQKKGWTIKTMDSVFNDDSFVEASRKACTFIYNSKGLNHEQQKQ